MGLQIRRGTDAERLTITPSEGEPIWTTDTEKLYIGDGTTVGGVLASPDQLVGITNSPEFANITIDNTATVGALVFASDTGTVITSRSQLIGPTGYTGSVGINGFTGSQGDVGYTGSKGDLGYTGSQGVGYTGSAGSQGYTGSKGDLGYTGSTGAGYTGSQGIQGYTGSRGATGQSSNYYRYKAKTTLTSGDPLDGFLIWNNATQRSATQINLSHLDDDGNDIDVFLALLNSGDNVIVQDQNDSNNYQIWTVSSTIVVHDNQYVEVPVTLTSSTGTGYTGFANNHPLLFIVQNAGVQGPIGYTGSKGDTGYTGSKGDLGYAGSQGYTGSKGDQGYTGSAGSYDQSLNTTDVVTFKGVKSTNVVSAGGYPLDANGQALIRTTNTQTPALVAGNYTSGILPEIVVRGYGQNRPGTVGATTAASPGIFLEGSRGTHSSPTAIGSGDSVFIISGGGYDGNRWSNDVGLGTVQILGLTTEAWAGSATTTTNAGSRLFMRVQPQGAQLNTTSRKTFFSTTWTAGNTATTSPPTLNLLFGNADNSAPTLTPSSGTGSFGTGYGATSVNWINSKQTIFGVPSEDSSPDNTTLTSTNYIMFSSGRRSGASGRRNALSSGDSIGNLYFYGQTASSATSVGSVGGFIRFKAVENWTGSVQGTQAIISTVNSGTTTVSDRLVLDNTFHVYKSDAHYFKNAAGTLVADLATSGITLYTTATITGSIIPSADSTYDLGSSTKKWRSLYVSTSTIYIDGSAVSVAGGQLTINGSTQIGPTGYTGSAGPIGYTGSQGATGYTGSQGPGIALTSASGTQSLTTSSGLLVSITDGAGKLAYYNTTLGDWRYVGDDSDVYVPSYSIDYLVVAGGGGGQQAGAGAGGYTTGTTTVTGGTSYTITVGAGGAGSSSNTAANGSNSSITGLSTSTGGGWSGTDAYGNRTNGNTGGSGGGGAYNASGGAGTAGQGNAGGNGYSGSPYTSGGGGGAGAAGQVAQVTKAGDGGTGKSWFNGTTYAGGGGGCYQSNAATSPGSGGSGGGGNGGGSGGANGSNGTANTGGGAGGSSGGTGGTGGSGVVIIRYSGTQGSQTGGTVTTASGYTYHTFTASGTFVS